MPDKDTTGLSFFESEIVDYALIALFGLIALIGFLIALVPVFSFLVEGVRDFEFIPLFLGPALASLGCLVLVSVRRKWRVACVPLGIALFLVLGGFSVFSFGVTAAFLYDEPNEFASNFGFSVGLCMLPGAFLAGLGLLLYISDGIRNRRRASDVDVDTDNGDGSPEWLDKLKDRDVPEP